MVADRRRHLVYLKAKNEKAHNALVKKLGLKK
jgi:ribosomal protein S15P/S13E